MFLENTKDRRQNEVVRTKRPRCTHQVQHDYIEPSSRSFDSTILHPRGKGGHPATINVDAIVNTCLFYGVHTRLCAGASRTNAGTTYSLTITPRSIDLGRVHGAQSGAVAAVYENNRWWLHSRRDSKCNHLNMPTLYT